MVTEGPGRVYVVATPIGNLDDLSARAIEVLRAVDVIACEDTRHTAKLTSRFDIATRRVSLHAHNERARIPGLIEDVRSGASIAVVSDAGTPLVSDPGERLVAAAVEAGLEVVPVPGPSAVLAALVASGFPTQPFAFAGFLPRKGADRARALDQFAAFPGTVLLFESPRRIARTLEDLRAHFGARRAALCRELTKVHEEVLRGRLGELTVPDGARGEFTIAIEPPLAAASVVSPEAIDARIDTLRAEGLSNRDVAATLAREFDLPRSAAYARVLGQRSH